MRRMQVLGRPALAFAVLLALAACGTAPGGDYDKMMAQRQVARHIEQRLAALEAILLERR